MSKLQIWWNGFRALDAVPVGALLWVAGAMLYGIVGPVVGIPCLATGFILVVIGMAALR